MKPLLMLAALRREIPRVLPLMRHGSVPKIAKVSAVVAALLIISPLDIFGDIPILGLFDDVALLALVAHVFVSFAERTVASSRFERNVTPQGSAIQQTR